MGLYYGMADREPHSDAFRFRGKEWLEDAVGQLRRDSWSRILNLNQNTISVLCRPDQNFAPPACGRIVASIAFMIRLISTCCNCTGSPGTLWQVRRQIGA